MTDHAEKAREMFFKGYNCAQSIMCAFSDVTGYDLNTSARMASSFGGGMGRLRQTCGAVSGAALVLGIVKGYDDPTDYEAKKQHYVLVREFAERFKEKNVSINCGELLKLASVDPKAGGNPEKRSEEYYKKRPCPQLIYDAARILDEMLFPRDDSDGEKTTDLRSAT